MVLFYVMGDI